MSYIFHKCHPLVQFQKKRRIFLAIPIWLEMFNILLYLWLLTFARSWSKVKIKPNSYFFFNLLWIFNKSATDNLYKGIQNYKRDKQFGLFSRSPMTSNFAIGWLQLGNGCFLLSSQDKWMICIEGLHITHRLYIICVNVISNHITYFF